MIPARHLRLARTATALAVCLPALGGCAAMRTQIQNGSLDLQHRVSNSVFLSPSRLPRILYVETWNTSGLEASVDSTLRAHFRSIGYEITDDPFAATYHLQVNIRDVQHRRVDDRTDVQDAMTEAALGGAVMAAAAATLGGDAGKGIAEEVLVVGAILAFILDARTQAVAYTMTTDVRLTERVEEPDGTRASVHHEVQIVGAATKVNLEADEAVPALARDLAGVLGGFLSPAVRAVALGPGL